MSAIVDEIVALASALSDSVDRLPRWLGEAGVDVPETRALRERLAEYAARARIAMRGSRGGGQHDGGRHDGLVWAVR